MLEQIEQMKKELDELIKTHDLNDKVVLDASWKLDNLILGYYSIGYNYMKLNFNHKKHGKRINTKKLISIRSMV